MSAAGKSRILILDDEPIVCDRLKPALEKRGYEVESFTESSEAMQRIKEKEFDVIITDLKMPGIDGIQFLEEIKRRSEKTEVIMITGFATMESAKESFHKGVFDFIAKPFRLREIKEVVQRAEAKIREKVAQN